MLYTLKEKRVHLGLVIKGKTVTEWVDGSPFSYSKWKSSGQPKSYCAYAHLKVGSYGEWETFNKDGRAVVLCQKAGEQII